MQPHVKLLRPLIKITTVGSARLSVSDGPGVTGWHCMEGMVAAQGWRCTGFLHWGLSSSAASTVGFLVRLNTIYIIKMRFIKRSHDVSKYEIESNVTSTYFVLICYRHCELR